jgi:hypothetical protein
MILATLYSDQGKSETIDLNQLGLESVASSMLPATAIATILRCSPKLVDVLATGANYTVFSVFDHDGATNVEAMDKLTQVTGYEFDISDDDHIIRGPVLLVYQV